MELYSILCKDLHGKIILKRVERYIYIYIYKSFPDGSDGKESACNGRDPGSVPRLGRSPGKGNDYSLQYSCLENPMDREAWQDKVYGISKSGTQLSE